MLYVAGSAPELALLKMYEAFWVSRRRKNFEKTSIPYWDTNCREVRECKEDLRDRYTVTHINDFPLLQFTLCLVLFLVYSRKEQGYLRADE
jgi:hypothetical protein